MKFSEYLKEAEEIKMKDLKPEKLSFLKKHKLNSSNSDVFSGIH